MQSNQIRCCTSVVAFLAVLLTVAIRPAAAAAPSEVAALMHIRALIATADHDYKGHRIAALKAIEDACHDLGLEIKGDGHDRTLQGNSDSMLRQADHEIANLRPVAEQNNQSHVLEDLDKASKRIQKALEAK